jgi:hypothetical protein
MNSKLLLIVGSFAVLGTAWAQDAPAAASGVPDYLKAQSATEYVGGSAATASGAVRVGDARWILQGGKSVESLEQHSRRALEEAATKHGLRLGPEGEGALVATTWQTSYRKDRAMVPVMAEAERAEKCVEKGPEVGRIVAGAVGLLALGVDRGTGASMIGSGARAGHEGLQWQKFSHLAAADRVACGSGEFVLETKVTLTGGSGAGLEFVVRSAVPGGATPAEAAKLVGRNADAVALELKALQAGTCDRAIRCGDAVAAVQQARSQ